jgi:hypothetical protein
VLLAVTVLSINMVGDGLRDYLDPLTPSSRAMWTSSTMCPHAPNRPHPEDQTNVENYP